MGIEERYDCGEKLYQSANNLVRRAVRKSDGKRVVMKELREVNEERIARFKREYELTKEMQSQHVIKSYDWF